MSLPILYFHDRTQRGAPIPDATRGLLLRLVSADSATASDRSAYRDFLVELHDGSQWLACGCRGDASTDAPILFPRRPRHRVIHLVRHGKEVHADGCPFAQLADRRDLAEIVDEKSNDPLRWDGRWLVHRPESTLDAADRKARGPGRRADQRVAPLRRQLLTLLEDAGYTTLVLDDIADPARVSLHDAKKHFDRMRFANPSLEGDLSFQDIAFHYLPDLPDRMVRTDRLRGAIPADLPLQAYYFGPVDAIELAGGRRAILARAVRTPTEAPVWIPVRHAVEGASSDAGPFWALCHLEARGDDPTQLEAVHACVLPALTRGCLLPLDDAAERPLARMLIQLMSYWRTTAGVRAPLRLRKPLLAAQAGDRPAFTIELGRAGAVVVYRDRAGADERGVVFAGDEQTFRREATRAMWDTLRARRAENANE